MNPGIEDFYIGDFRSKLLFKARTGLLEVNGRTHRWSGKSENCEYCIIGVKETIEHMIIECMGHEQERKVLIGEMKNLIGEKKWDEVKARDDEGLSVILDFECEDEMINMHRMKVVNITKVYQLKVWNKRE